MLSVSFGLTDEQKMLAEFFDDKFNSLPASVAHAAKTAELSTEDFLAMDLIGNKVKLAVVLLNRWVETILVSVALAWLKYDTSYQKSFFLLVGSPTTKVWKPLLQLERIMKVVGSILLH